MEIIVNIIEMSYVDNSICLDERQCFLFSNCIFTVQRDDVFTAEFLTFFRIHSQPPDSNEQILSGICQQSGS